MRDNNVVKCKSWQEPIFCLEKAATFILLQIQPPNCHKRTLVPFAAYCNQFLSRHQRLIVAL